MSDPRISFLVGGVQKGGTTALASFIAAHPDIALPRQKEAHLFDDAAFDPSWSVADIDARYAMHFDAEHARLFGDATPIYILHPVLVRRIAAYNPGMKWILILRHPVERALSHYHMERARGREYLPFWLALACESRRLRAYGDDCSRDSPLSRHSYRLRGDYARQLDVLYGFFPHDQVLVLRNAELSHAPGAVMARVWEFLGVDPPAGDESHPRVFEGHYRRLRRGGLRWRFYEWLFRRELAAQVERYGLHWSAAAD
ncbi:sulfotransferase domain-containing protein [uncultured Luteimonas sp.]|uniref:sulfotransferase domain-containing protein n=1 Tax=uncultured Luteimonas sp. TaxID=453144 RepID=UPI002602F138|nr:sulfotransferase domain-containing protein [uncultured Luteimonas sp.]